MTSTSSSPVPALRRRKENAKTDNCLIHLSGTFSFAFILFDPPWNPFETNYLTTIGKSLCTVPK